MSEAYVDHRLMTEFRPTTWSQGVRYFEQGRVARLEPLADGEGWSALVRGSPADPYEVWVHAEPDEEEGVFFDGECTCPLEAPCKHMAATLVAVRREVEHAVTTTGADRRRVCEELVAMQRWARSLQGRDPSTPAARESSRRIAFVVYVIGGPPGPPRRVCVSTYAAALRKDGSVGKANPCNIIDAFARRGCVPGYATIDDQVLWFRAMAVGGEYFHRPPLPRSREATALFHDLVRTGRCHFKDLASPPLQLGPSRPGRVEWIADARGRQRITIAIDGEPQQAIAVVPLSPPHYVDLASGQTGPLDLEVPDSIVDLPELDAETVSRLPPGVEAALAKAGVPAPRPLPVRWRTESNVHPHLRIGLDSARARLGGAFADAFATLSADYGPAPVLLADDSPEPVTSVLAGGDVVKVLRDPQRESAFLDRVSRLGFSCPEPDTGRMTLANEAAWRRVIETDVPQLREEGWRVDIGADVPTDVVEADAWYLDTSEDTEGGEWFRLELGVVVDGERIDLTPAVVAAIRSGRIQRDRFHLDAEAIDLPLPDNRWVRLTTARLTRVLDTLVELFDERPGGGTIRVCRGTAAWLATLEEFEWLGPENLRELARQLARADPLPPVPVPRALRATLRDYQSQGLDWLQLLRAHGFGGVLADDMGLGKTVQALAHLLAEKRARRLDRPCLVVAPLTVIHNWVRECRRFAPTLSCAAYHGPNRQRVLAGDRPDIVVTTYALLHRDDALREIDWHVVILDEAQAIKNPHARATEAAYALRARQRICLTGTPMENNLEELWSIFSVANPGLLGGLQWFRARFRNPIERRGDPRRLAALSARIAPFMLRRTKTQVLAELPPKTEILVDVPLRGRQLDVYESVRMTMERRVRRALRDRGLARSRIIVLDALLKLRQVCCHPSLVKSEEVKAAAVSSAKTERLMELIAELHAEGRHVLVFSQFTSMLEIIAHALQAAKIGFETITGKTRNRQSVVDRFQAREFPVLLVSLKAGGTGINLTSADTVIHYDPWWNPAVEDQATDRAHRIGQERPITVYRLVCEGTVEHRMLELQDAKRSLTEAIQAGAESRGAAGFRLGPEDIDRLLAPADRA